MTLWHWFSRLRAWLTQRFIPRIDDEPDDPPTEPTRPVILPEDWLNRYAQAALYGNEAAQDGAIRALVMMSRASNASLLEHLQSPNAFVRAGVIRVLIEAQTQDMTGALCVVLQEYDDLLYRAVIDALNRLHIPADELVVLLDVPQPRVRAAALALLGQAGEAGVTRTITRIALYEENDEVRAAAILALAQIRHPQSVESLKLGLYNTNSLVVRRAGEALLRIGTPEAKQAIQTWRERRFGSSVDYVARQDVTDEYEQIIIRSNRPDRTGG